jgi:nitroimidazol reductase NimA-like FMN-containing flavoprotein (pyridoxamine 5'-phosphate oxidase superfamily)
MTTRVGETERTTVHRVPAKKVNESSVVHAILDAGLVAHIGVTIDGQPYVMPVGYARDGNRVLFHGSSASRLFKALAAGAPTCFTVTLLDGLVVSRSQFESSMNYRSVVALGVCEVLEGDEKMAALLRITEHLLPGRENISRAATAQEAKATTMVALKLDECSCKVSDKMPEEVPEDLTDPIYSNIWAGRVPMREVFDEPIADELTAQKAIPTPDFIKEWRR